MAITEQLFVCGALDTRVGVLPQVRAGLFWRDHLGAALARLGVGRMRYTVEPGLYALGRPGEDSPVLVTANYKMSFDHLRRALAGYDAWLLVLDTNGINVWCAAGKGTFGTVPLCAMVENSGLASLVRHRRLILPQLGAPGVAAHLVKKQSGFSVVYGPVLARDLPDFLAAGLQATPAMRRKTFTLRERAVLIPLEFFIALKWGVALSLLLYLFAGFFGADSFQGNALANSGAARAGLWSGILAGAVFTPLFLPLLPGRAFSIKGAVAGLPTSFVTLLVLVPDVENWIAVLGALLFGTSISSFLGMEFTGASTYTSLSGVKKEMRIAVPAQIAAGIFGFLSLFTDWVL